MHLTFKPFYVEIQVDFPAVTICSEGKSQVNLEPGKELTDNLEQNASVEFWLSTYFFKFLRRICQKQFL